MSEQDISVFSNIFIQLLVVSFALSIISTIWAVRDAERRGKSGVLVGLLVFFFAWPLGLIAWLALRPAQRLY